MTKNAKNTKNTTNKRLETFLPSFGGFYQSHWEQLLSDAEELYTTMHAETERAQGGLSRADIAGIFSETGNTSRLCTALARSFCEHFDEEMSERLGFRLGLKFVELKSPSEYNFTTDRIVATMPLRSAKKLFYASMSERHRRLNDEIVDWFTPYPGFVPYYSDYIGDWIAKPIDKWDENELCVLLDAFVDTDIDEEIYHAVAEHDACSAFEESVDWKRFEEKAALLRRSKTKAFLESLEFDGEAS
ncbi:hypothetical protein [Bradyrhizobium elkanii]|uniref:hypothetical protein n=1 Tax=Bradyrhizobium elkanii TaxID=29448 RepID=UPI0004B716CC|nr:hypothetical protein [Bradyrhizobium elkanii]WLA83205.1 hypothetical protein QNJ99_02355 [Bradyrhizobium elkanii]